MHDLSRISRILEQNQIVSIETNISALLAFVEQILTNLNHAAIEMIRSFRKNFVTLELVLDMRSSMMSRVLFSPPSKMLMSGTPSTN